VPIHRAAYPDMISPAGSALGGVAERTSPECNGIEKGTNRYDTQKPSLQHRWEAAQQAADHGKSAAQAIGYLGRRRYLTSRRRYMNSSPDAIPGPARMRARQLQAPTRAISRLTPLSYSTTSGWQPTSQRPTYRAVLAVRPRPPCRLHYRDRVRADRVAAIHRQVADRRVLRMTGAGALPLA